MLLYLTVTRKRTYDCISLQKFNHLINPYIQLIYTFVVRSNSDVTLTKVVKAIFTTQDHFNLDWCPAYNSKTRKG